MILSMKKGAFLELWMFVNHTLEPVAFEFCSIYSYQSSFFPSKK